MLLAVCFAFVVPHNTFAEDEAEQKVYQEMHSEVKTAFDNAKDNFTNLYKKSSPSKAL